MFVSHREFTTAAEIHANHKAVRERLMQPQTSTAAMKKLENKIDDLEATVSAQNKVIEALELSRADYEAAMLCQAHMLIDAYRQSGLESEKHARRSPRAIIESVLEDFHPDVSFSDVVGPKRSRYLVAARHQCMKAVYNERKDLSFPQIGRIFNRDHTLVLYACDRLPGKMKGQKDGVEKRKSS